MKMGECVEVAGFLLPSEFLTDDDFLMEKENFIRNNNNAADSSTNPCFPADFPYHLETADPGENIKKSSWVMSSSPQSTLAHQGSWSGSSKSGVEDMIFAAATEVVKLKLGGGDGTTQHNDFMPPPRSFSQIDKNSVFQNIQENDVMKQHNQGHYLQKLYQNRNESWTIQQNPVRFVGSGQRAVLFGGSGAVKRECTGTGVFLPRRYGNVTSDSRKKPDLLKAPRKAVIYQHEPRMAERSSSMDMYRSREWTY